MAGRFCFCVRMHRAERGPRLNRCYGPAGQPSDVPCFLSMEAPMMSEVQVHTVARQMLEQHGFAAIAKAAEQAQACEGRGDAEEAREWRHIADAMKIMRGPAHS